MSEGERVLGGGADVHTVRNQNTATQLCKCIGVKTVADRTGINGVGINICKDWAVYTTHFILFAADAHLSFLFSLPPPSVLLLIAVSPVSLSFGSFCNFAVSSFSSSSSFCRCLGLRRWW